MSPGATMERVYESLKAQIRLGQLLPGERLDAARLAPDLNASTTPVRDALHRLGGERLVEIWPQEGFRVPAISEPFLRDIYPWMLELLLLALRRGSSAQMPEWRDERHGMTDTAEGVAERTGHFCAAIGRYCANFEVRLAIANASDRLHVVRLAETRLIPDGAGELQVMEDHFAALDLAGLRRALTLYHRRRLALVPQLAGLMRRPPATSPVP